MNQRSQHVPTKRSQHVDRSSQLNELPACCACLAWLSTHLQLQHTQRTFHFPLSTSTTSQLTIHRTFNGNSSLNEPARHHAESMPWQKGQLAGLAFSLRLVSCEGRCACSCQSFQAAIYQIYNLHAHLFLAARSACPKKLLLPFEVQ